MTFTTTQDYRDVLRERLEARCAKNPRYSLRSFARDLGLSPSRLSDVLNGRYGLSRAAAERLAASLGLNAEETARFCDQVESRHARSPKRRAEAQLRIERAIPDYRTLTLDGFRVISDWYHYAILELCLLPEFKSEPAWIAGRLGLNELVAEAAIERLLRLDLLRRSDSGALEATESFTASPAEVPSDAIKKFHRQILEKAMQAIDFQDLATRDLGSMLLAINTADLPAAKAELKRFRREFDERFGLKPGAGAPPDSVYCLSTQLFRLDEKN